MKISKIISIVLLILFGITLPASLLVTDISRQLGSKESLAELTMTAVLSNEALPKRINETIWYHHWFGKKLEFGPRFLITSIHGDQWGELLGIILPLKQRKKLVDTIFSGGFDWLENGDAYPDIRIEFAPVLSKVKGNADKIALWAVNTLKVPQCKEERLKDIQAGNYGDDLKTVISCKPPVAQREGLARHLAPMIRNQLEKANPPQGIDLGGRLKDRLQENRLLAIKAKLNRARQTLPRIWLLPFVIFALALAITVRSRQQLMRWAGWPLLISSVIGGILAWWISNPLPALEDLFIPPPAQMPPQAVPVVKGILAQLLTTASGMMTWQIGILFLTGAGLLFGAYWNRFTKQPGSKAPKDI